MEHVKTKIKFMSDILDKKIQLLTEIKNITLNQSQVIKKDNGLYSAMADEKQTRIDEVMRADDVFNRVFLEINKDDLAVYKEEISTLKDKIKDVMDLDIAIRVTEERNKRLFSVANKKLNIPKSKNFLKHYEEQKKISKKRF